MADVLKDRQYYKMLSSNELLDIAYREGNELAIAALEPRRAALNYRLKGLHKPNGKGAKI